mgnify:CR=1 FL=1
MKLTYTQKLLVVKDCEQFGVTFTARKWLLSISYVSNLFYKAKNNCLLPHGHSTKYSPEFKIRVAKAYAEGNSSLEDIAQLYGILTQSSVKSWYDIYQSQGEKGLINMNAQGRPTKKSSAKNSKKINVNKLIDSEKPFSEYTHEEEKALKMELLRLRCHEEFSKKFEALTQEYLRKKNNK